MNRKIALAVLSLALATPAVASNSCQISYPIVSGIFTHGSMICKPEWLDRDASIIMMALTSGCRSMGEKKLISLAMRGGRDFDRKVEELGKIDACKMLDVEMTNIEKAAAAAK